MIAKQQRARYIRYAAIGVLILIDLLILPQALFFFLVVKLHGIVHAPAIWLHSLSMFGGVVLIPRVFQLWGWMQLIVGLLIFLTLTSGRSLGGSYDPEGDPQAAGSGQFGSSRWQTEREIDGNFTVRKF
jgi:type IV secretion system protein VirD4